MSPRLLLPTLADAEGAGAATCSDAGYVTKEEMTVLVRIRALGEQARRLRGELQIAARCSDTEAQREIIVQLESLRAERRRLDPLREAAWRRKMIALGHLENDIGAGEGT